MSAAPTPGSLRYGPDLMELEAIAGGGAFLARFSDSSGRARAATAWRDLRAASGVVVLEARATIVTSEALFAFADARCSCGADALVDVHEVYKRTHGGPAPARLLRGLGLGRALRGRCRCGAALEPSRVRAAVEAPFARVAVLGDADLGRLRRITGFSWRSFGSSS